MQWKLTEQQNNKNSICKTINQKEDTRFGFETYEQISKHDHNICEDKF
jgi:hypothetical protein